MVIVMAKKYAILMLGLAVAGTVGPMAYFHFFDHGKTPSQGTAAERQAGPAQTVSYQTTVTVGDGLGGSEIPASIAGPAAPGAPAPRQPSVRIHDASSVFDFHITPEWIVSHWPTVSTGLAQLQLEGYRVALVTGTTQQDLAGALTYYFNPEQKLAQITFIGTTGDPRQLIGLLINRFHLTRRLVNDPGLVSYESVHANNKLASTLRIRLAPLAKPNDLFRRYDIELSLVESTE